MHLQAPYTCTLKFLHEEHENKKGATTTKGKRQKKRTLEDDQLLEWRRCRGGTAGIYFNNTTATITKQNCVITRFNQYIATPRNDTSSIHR